MTATDRDAGITPLLLTPEQAAHALGIGRTRLYQLLATGQLASVKLGGSRRISRRALQTYVDGLERPKVTPVDETAPAARPRSHRPSSAVPAEPLSLPFT